MAALTFKEELEALKVQVAEVRRLKEENKRLHENLATLTESFSYAKEIQAKRESVVSALKEKLTTVNVQIEENHRLKKDNKTLKKRLRSWLRTMTRTLTDLKKPATPQASKCLKRKRNQRESHKKSSGIPETKRVKDDIDRSENSPDRSSDDCDSDSDSKQ